MTTPTREQIIYLIRDVKFDVKTTDEAADAILALFEPPELIQWKKDADAHNLEVIAMLDDQIKEFEAENGTLTARVVELEADNKKLFTLEDVETAIDLAVSDAPFLLGNADWKDHSSRVKLYSAGLLASMFPEAKPGHSGRQFWMFKRLVEKSHD